MATSSLASSFTSPTSSSSPFSSHPLSKLSTPPLLSFSCSLKPFLAKSKTDFFLQKRDTHGLPSSSIRAQTLDFSSSFFEGGFGSEDDSPSQAGPGVTAVEDKPEPQCPPGLHQYETMAVLRPDMSEDERLALTQKYEEVI